MTEESASIRRTILSILTDRDTVTRSELAELLAADPSISTSDHRHLEIILHHHHLPLLDEESFLEYDRRSGDVIRWLEIPAIEAHLDQGWHHE